MSSKKSLIPAAPPSEASAPPQLATAPSSSTPQAQAPSAPEQIELVQMSPPAEPLKADQFAMQLLKMEESLGRLASSNEDLMKRNEELVQRSGTIRDAFLASAAADNENVNVRATVTANFLCDRIRATGDNAVKDLEELIGKITDKQLKRLEEQHAEYTQWIKPLVGKGPAPETQPAAVPAPANHAHWYWLGAMCAISMAIYLAWSFGYLEIRFAVS